MTESARSPLEVDLDTVAPATVTDHIARPGPDYWSWRCLVCSEPCAAHPGVLRFLWQKLARR